MRCFVGLALPAAYGETLQAVRDAWAPRLDRAAGATRRLVWTRPGTWHCTLKFLGEVAPAALPRLEAALLAIRQPPFTLQAGGGGVFPPMGGRRPPRVAWVGLRQGAVETTRLANAVDEAAAACGVPSEERAFTPHLTLFRVKDVRGNNRKAPAGRARERPAERFGDALNDFLAALETMDHTAWPAVEVAACTLWRSHLHAEGPRYEPLCQIPLNYPTPRP